MAENGDRTPLTIVGAGGFGREVLDVIEAQRGAGPAFDFLGFVDDGDPRLDLLSRRGAVLLSGLDDPRLDGAAYLIGIADPQARRSVDARAAARGLTPAQARHPSATFGADVVAGPGFVVCAHVGVTTNVRIGRHVHLNLHVTMGHDCVVGDYVTVSHGARVSGDVRLEDDVMVGTGAAIIQGVTVGARTIVGAGAVVTRDLPPGVVAMGAPARPVRQIDGVA